MWDNLMELTQLNSAKGNRIKAVLEFNPDRSGPAMEFYHLLLQGKLSASFFDKKKREGQGAAFFNELKEELVNTYFFSSLERSGFQDRQNAEVECWKNWVAVKMLFGKSAMIFPQKTCLKILKQAERYDFHKITIEVAKQLRLYYGAQLGDDKRFKKYDELIKVTHEKHKWEKLAKRKLNQLKVFFLKGKLTEDQLMAELEKTLEELKEVPDSERSFGFEYYLGLVQLMSLGQQNDLAGIRRHCKKVVGRLCKKYHGRQGNADRVFYLAQAYACLLQGQHEEAAEILGELEGQEKKGSPAWFDMMGLKMVAVFHSKQFDRALLLFMEVKTHNKYPLLPPAKAALWKLFGKAFQLLEQFEELTHTEPSNPSPEQAWRTERQWESRQLTCEAQSIIFSLILGMHQNNEEEVKRHIGRLKKTLMPLEENGYQQLAAFSRFLINSFREGISPDTLRSQAEFMRSAWKAWPFLYNTEYSFFQTVLPFEYLQEVLVKTCRIDQPQH